jgi:Cdc6-like AAA superfamily ATPase
MSTIINLFGGPGVGKSTIAAELFSIMKKQNINVELTYEFPKEMVWEGNSFAVNDQLYILANQHRNITRLYGKLDYIIMDSPIILSCIYKNKYDSVYPNNHYEQLDKFVIDIFKKYNNINFLLKRNDVTFNETGRFQGNDDAKKIDTEIKGLLLSNNIPYHELAVDNYTAKKLFEIIQSTDYA